MYICGALQQQVSIVSWSWSWELELELQVKLKLEVMTQLFGRLCRRGVQGGL
jgi:hypothetical protein